MLAPGATLGDGARYSVVELLGVGGLSEVYRATDTVLGRDVAVKVLSTACPDGVQGLARLGREARVLAGLAHPGLPKVFVVEARATPPYVVTELLEGRTLREVVDDDGPLPPDEVAQLALTLAEALAFLHGRDVVHRDLKPSNVFCCDDGTYRLIDFGLALPGGQTRMTLDGQVLGTLGWLAPELLTGGVYSARSDVYQLGEVLCFAATGRRDGPVTGEGLAGVVEACRREAPDERPADGAAVLALLGPSMPRPPGGPVRRRRRRRKLLLPMAVATVVAGLLCFAVVRWLSGRSTGATVAWTSAVACDVAAERCRLTWRMAAATAARYELYRGADLVKRGGAPPSTWHDVVVSGLQPATAYRIVVEAGGVRRIVDVRTDAVRLVRAPWVAALRGHVAVDLATNVTKGVEVVVTTADAGDLRRPAEGGSGVTVVGPVTVRSGERLRWQVLHDGVSLANGDCPSEPEALRPFAVDGRRQGMTGDFRAPPLWVGDRFVTSDYCGNVCCFEPARGRAGGTGVRLAWWFVPPKPREAWLGTFGCCAVVGLDEGRVGLICGLGEGPLALWRLDVDGRAERWRAHGVTPPFALPPDFVLDKGDPWNEPGAGEWVQPLPSLPMAYPSGRPVRQGSLVVSYLASMTTVGFVAVDVEARRVLWCRPFDGAELQAAPFHDGSKAVPPVWRRGGGQPSDPPSDLLSQPVLVGDRVYELVELGRPADDRRRAALLSCRCTPDPSSVDGRVECVVDVAGSDLGMAAVGHGLVWVVCPDVLVELDGGRPGPPTLRPWSTVVPGLPPGYAVGAAGLADGRVCLLWGRRTVSYTPGGTTAPPVASFLSLTLFVLDPKGDGRAATAYEPPLYVEPGGTIIDVRSFRTCGSFVGGATRFALFAAEPSSGRHGFLPLHLTRQIRSWDIGDQGYLALLDVEGGARAMPMDLVLSGVGAPLRAIACGEP